MADGFFRKVSSTTLVAASDHDAELLKHIKLGDPTRMTFVRVRNYEFHKKFFALLDLAFDYWEPVPSLLPGQEGWEIEKNKDAFRKDLIIMAGFSNIYFRLDGTARVEAKSIAFPNMSEDTFEDLFTKVIDVIIKHVMTTYTDEMLRASVIEQVEAFE